MEIVYCGGGNRRFAEIAIAAGFRHGSQLPETVYFPLWFADQDWRNPDRAAYMAALAQHRPVMASVLDWEREEQLPEVLGWAEEAAQYVDRVMLIPKCIGGIPRLPRRINGADVVLGYSVPTQFGGTDLPLWEFGGWPVHLLGGSPQRQIQTWAHLRGVADVVSADGNMAQKMATRHCQFWVPGTAYGCRNRWWPTLAEADGARWPMDGPEEAWRRSCDAIHAEWVRIGAVREDGGA